MKAAQEFNIRRHCKTTGSATRKRTTLSISPKHQTTPTHDDALTTRGYGDHHPEPRPYETTVSIRFVALSLLLSTLLSYGVGHLARVRLIEPIMVHKMTTTTRSRVNNETYTNNEKTAFVKLLPPPTIIEGKYIPKTIYTSKNFDTSVSARSNSLLIQNPLPDGNNSNNKNDNSNAQSLSEDYNHDSSDISLSLATDDEVDDEEHLPSGQHLLIDIKNVNEAFLNDEYRLAHAMIDVVRQSQLTLLSYHCHGLEPMGVSCAGVLLESHIAFHTWPVEGVITIDLFTCGSGSLLPVLPRVVDFFGVPRNEEGEEDSVKPPEVMWAHKLRGFRDTMNPLAGDLGRNVLGVMNIGLKREVASTKTKFQDIHVYDIIKPRKRNIAKREHSRSLSRDNNNNSDDDNSWFSYESSNAKLLQDSINPHSRDFASYERSISNDDSYESRHAELFQPDRVIFVNGQMQANRHGDEPYHESLVHPGMFSHEHPRRVAIIGGGEGSTLREVLKHNTLEKVVMIEIDEMMVEFSKKYLPSWSDCGDIVGSTPSCFDDPRANVYYEDALSWFIDRFGAAVSDVSSQEEKFDIIIMDALVPEDNVEFADGLYRNDVLLKALYNALTPHGVLVMSLGKTPLSVDPADENKIRTLETLHSVQFNEFHVYEEYHSQFRYPRSYLLTCKDYRCRYSFLQNEAEMALSIHRRIARTHSGESSLKYFDGATMENLQMPHRVFETMYCRRHPTPMECKLLDSYKSLEKSLSASSLEVRPSSLGENAGNGIFAKVNMTKGTMLVDTDKVHFNARTLKIMNGFYNSYSVADDLESLLTYAEGYGVVDGEAMGNDLESLVVSSSHTIFVNHGCNGTNNLGDLEEYLCSNDPACTVYSEAMIDPNNGIPMYNVSSFEYTSLAYSRHESFFLYGYDMVLKDVTAGEEIFSNYLFYASNEDDFPLELSKLKDQCSGRGIGSITEYTSVSS